MLKLFETHLGFLKVHPWPYAVVAAVSGIAGVIWGLVLN
jgi:hypothetical protein